MEEEEGGEGIDQTFHSSSGKLAKEGRRPQTFEEHELEMKGDVYEQEILVNCLRGDDKKIVLQGCAIPPPSRGRVHAT